MVSTYSLPRLMEDEVSALVRSGHYSSKSDVIKDAMRTLFKSKSHLKSAAAIELLKEGKISLGKAAEIAEIPVHELQKMLEHHKIFRELALNKEDLEKISETK